MNTPDFHGHVFLPPSIKLPVAWMPVHDAAVGIPAAAIPLPTAGAMLQPGAGEVIRRPDLFSHS